MLLESGDGKLLANWFINTSIHLTIKLNTVAAIQHKALQNFMIAFKLAQKATVATIKATWQLASRHKQERNKAE